MFGKYPENKNYIYEEIKMRLKSGNACDHSMQNILPSSLLPKSIKIKLYRNMFIPVVLYRCESWSLTLRKGRRISVSENRALRKKFESKRDEVTAEWRRLHNEELCGCHTLPNIIRLMKKNEIGGAYRTYGRLDVGRIQDFG
jgi:hypothetical protein